jgi:hypothetical protein
MIAAVLLSPGGSPGVTVTALALTLAWPQAAVMAECDPAGGAVLAGMWQGQAAVTPGTGMVPFALAAQREPQAAADDIFGMSVPLERIPASRFVLPALPGPAAGRQLATAWPAVSAGFAAARPDVIADAGRYDTDPAFASVLKAAGQVLMVCRPTIGQAAAAKPRLAALAATRPADGLIVLGTGPYGGDGPKVMARELGVEVSAVLPWDPAAAGALSGTGHSRRLSRSPLLRAAARLAGGLATGHRASHLPASLGVPEVTS